jgi:hypothetical protein
MNSKYLLRWHKISNSTGFIDFSPSYVLIFAVKQQYSYFSPCYVITCVQQIIQTDVHSSRFETFSVARLFYYEHTGSNPRARTE